MNQSRRNQLRDIQQQLQDIYERLDILCNEEQEAYDNMPESIQDSARGDAAQSAIDTLESVRDQGQEASDGIDGIFE